MLSDSEIERWARLRVLFENAVSLQAPERAQYLKSVCSDDPSLHDELEKLFVEHDRTHSAFETAAGAAPFVESELNAHTIFGGRFEIVRQLGAGGMGQVYEALDRELGERVALKTVRAHLLLDPKIRERFKHEILNGRRVAHPNICRIYDFVRDGESGPNRLAFTMELLSGETLANLIEREGRLPVERALPLARQMAAGLTALHEQGIVHRDFKPANVMLIDGDGETPHVKITDFGLARREVGAGGADGGSLSGSRDLIGTPNYMAPEQLAGAREKVGPPTDVYALGLVLYEIVTGVPAFSTHTLAENAIQKNTQRPKAPSERAPDIPRVWDDVILRCLQVEPADRPQTPDEVIALIEGREGLGLLPRSKSVSRRGWTWAAAALILLALSPWVLRLSPDRGGDDLRVAVLPFSAAGGDRGFADGLMDTITKRLTQFEATSKKLDVVAASAVFGSKAAGALDARDKLGVDYAVEGNLQTQGERLRLTLSLVDANSGGQIDTGFVDGSLSNAIELEDAAVAKLATLLDLKIQPAHADSYEPVALRAPGAYRFYVQGLGYLQRSDQIASLDLAIGLFERALEEDRASAAAYAGLATAQWYRYERLSDASDAEKARRSAQTALDLDPEFQPALAAMGRVLCGVGQYEKALEYLNRAVQRDPKDGEAFALLAHALDRLGRPDEAEAAFQTATMRRPWDWSLHKQLGLFYLEQSKFEQAIESLREVVELSPDNAQGYSNLGAAYYRAGRLEEARRWFEKALEFERRPSALANLGVLAFKVGDYATAARYYREALESDANNHSLWGNLASARYWAGDNQYKDAYAQAIRLLHLSLDVNPRRTDLYGDLALYEASLGEISKARQALGRASEETTHATASELVRIGHVHELLGERSAGIEFLKRGVAAGFPVEELHRMPRFKQLLASPEWQRVSAEEPGR